MKQVEVFTSQDAAYETVCAFAQQNYSRTLRIKIGRFPDLFFAIVEEGRVFGCLGINTRINFDLFRQHPALQILRGRCGERVVFAEQSILAIENFAPGLPLIFAAATSCAQANGIQKIVYAGISVSCRTLGKMGYRVHDLGPADLSVLPVSQQQNYRHWYTVHHPVINVVDTSNSMEIFDQTFERFRRRAEPGVSLHDVLLRSE